MRTWFIRIIELALQRWRDRHLLVWPSCNFPARGQARRSREPASPSKLVESAARRNIREHVKIDLDEDEIRRLIDAVDYYEAYLHSQQRGREEVPRTAPGACLWQRIAFKGAKFCTNCDAPWY